MTIARTLTNTFAGIDPTSVPLFLVCQLAGAALAVVVGRFWYPQLDTTEMVVAHE